MIREFPLEEVGLIDVKSAAARGGWAVKTVQNWINSGLIPVAIAGAGMRRVFLLRIADVDTFDPPKRGPKPGNQNAKKPAGKRRKK